jgi:mannitol/fructose-specific phosphotransferase system IIA component (Ntr-type)
LSIERITDFVPLHGIRVPLHSTCADQLLPELASWLARTHGMNEAEILAALREREALGITALGDQIALPHGRADVAHTVGVVGVSELGVDVGAPDGAPAHVFVALLSPPQGNEHLLALAAVSRQLGDPTVRAGVLAASDAASVYAMLSEAVV